VLLHQRGGSAADWQPLMARLKALSVSALAIDQRGAGRSKGKRNGEDAPWDTTLDVAGAVSWLTRQALAPKHVGVAGASYGANNALVYAAASRDVPAVALLSPGTDYHGITIPPALSSFRGRILVLAASGDSSMRGGPEAIRRLSPSAEIETYAGDAHGTNLFWSNPESVDAVATFLARSL
jgi:pimeloyl-ACP methyl ester carboxylesterase